MLITPFEVVTNAPVSRDYPTTHLCVLLPQIEQAFVRECLGKELYDYLVSKLNTYPSGVVDWVQGVAYGVGSFVLRNGCTYECLIDGIESDPATDTESWRMFKKFTDAAANELWEKYLKLVLALKGYVATIVPNTFKSNAGGLIINDGDGTGNRSARKAELLEVKTHTITEIERVTTNMVEWLNENAFTKQLPWKNPCSTTNCATVGKNSRRWGFR